MLSFWLVGRVYLEGFAFLVYERKEDWPLDREQRPISDLSVLRNVGRADLNQSWKEKSLGGSFPSLAKGPNPRVILVKPQVAGLTPGAS